MTYHFASIPYVKRYIKTLKPLCYKITSYVIDNDRRMTFGDPIFKLKLHRRSDEYYINLLERLALSTETYIYSQGSVEVKNCWDVFLYLHLIDIVNDRIVFHRDLIKIWKEKYYSSFNWYDYYKQDLRDGVLNAEV